MNSRVTLGLFTLFAAALLVPPAVDLAAAKFGLIASITVLCFMLVAIVPASQLRSLGFQPFASLMAQITGFGFAWAALSIAGAYWLTALEWEHDWQYPFYFALPAAFAFWLAGRITRASPEQLARMRPALRATAAFQALAACAALWMLASVPAADVARPDWAAGIIFMRGSALLAALGVVGLVGDLLRGRDT